MTDPHYITIDGQQVVLHPAPLWEATQRDGTPSHFWGLANSVRIPVGMEPGSAWMVVTRSFINAIDLDSVHSIQWKYFEGDTGSSKDLNLYNYVVYGADCIHLDGDEKAAYLVEFRDKRHLLKKGDVLNVAYNLTVPKAPTTSTDPAIYREWLDSSTNFGTPWTWQEILEDLWGKLDNSYAGTCPELAWTPDHDPHNLRFYGVSAWDAIGEILESCQAVLAPTASGFELHDLCVEQYGLSSKFGAIANKCLWDAKPKPDANYAGSPKTVRVLFPRRDWDETTVPPPHTWEESAHHVDIETEIDGAYGVLPIWSDLPAEVMNDGTIANSTDCTVAATELVEKLAARIDLLTDLLEKHHSGYRNNPALGSQIHEIVYRDYGDVDGFRTEYRSLWSLRWPARERQPHIGWLRPIPPGTYIAKVGEGGIPARAGITLGSATVDLYQVVDGDLTATNRSALVYNLNDFAIAADTWVLVNQETVTGALIVAPSSGSGWYIGVVITSDIGPGGTGTVEQCGDDPSDWTPTGTTFSAKNPHNVTLKVGLHVRWTTYPAWTGWIVEPWDWSLC